MLQSFSFLPELVAVRRWGINGFVTNQTALWMQAMIESEGDAFFARVGITTHYNSSALWGVKFEVQKLVRSGRITWKDMDELCAPTWTETEVDEVADGVPVPAVS